MTIPNPYFPFVIKGVSMHWNDHKERCHWANPKNPLYIAYHDTEWGAACS